MVLLILLLGVGSLREAGWASFLTWKWLLSSEELRSLLSLIMAAVHFGRILVLTSLLLSSLFISFHFVISLFYILPGSFARWFFFNSCISSSTQFYAFNWRKHYCQLLIKFRRLKFCSKKIPHYTEFIPRCIKLFRIMLHIMAKFISV